MDIGSFERKAYKYTNKNCIPINDKLVSGWSRKSVFSKMKKIYINISMIVLDASFIQICHLIRSRLFQVIFVTK